MFRLIIPVLFAACGLAWAAPPVFSKAQADAGAKLYKVQCAACHGSTLMNGGAPKLAGPVFMKKWGANTLDDLYFIMSTAMPQTKPGSLKEAEYLNVLAYILQQNGFKDAALAKKDLKSYTFKK